MSNPNGQRGTRAETAVVDWLKGFGPWPNVERRAKNGAKDRGDIAGLGVVIEVKDCARMELAGWLSELRDEMRNDNARFGAVWHKRRGKGSPGDWYVTMSGDVFADLLREVLAK